MGIIQNEVVWNQNTGEDFRYAVNFAIIVKIQGIEKIHIFAMHSKLLYDSEFAKFRLAKNCA